MPEIVGRLRTPRLASPPSSPAPGEVYYDTVLSQLLYWDGTKWNQGPTGTVYDSDYIGTIKAFAGPAVPTNWMLCDGRTLDKTVYPELFNVIGYVFGGSGNNFLLPDLRSKFIYGVAQTDLSDLGSVGGVSTVTLALSQIPAHAHAGSAVVAAGNFGGSTDVQGNHFHTPTVPTDVFMLNTGGQQINFGSSGNVDERCTSLDNQTNTTGAHSHAVNLNNHGHGLTITSEGGGGSHENLPPYIRMLQIIKVTGAQINAGGALVGPAGPKGADSTVPGPTGPTGPAGPGVPTGGLTGQVLTKTSAVDFATAWQAVPAAGHTIQDEGTPLTFRAGLNFIGASVTVTDDSGNGRTNVTISAPPAEVNISTAGPSPRVGEVLWVDTDEATPGFVPVPALVTSLPATPVDGQEIYFLADATNGIVWHLRYRAVSASPYKWEKIGGPPMEAYVDTTESSGSTAYVDLTTVGPSLTLPLAGEYEIDHGCAAFPNSATAENIWIAAKLGAAATSDNEGEYGWTNAANQNVNVHRKMKRTISTSNTVVKQQYKVVAGVVCNWRRRYLRCDPVRVG